MKLASSVGDERAVSHVLGVVLMVAVTVSLAGVVHAFAFDVGEEALQEPAPKAAFDVDSGTCDGTKTVITHQAGETVPADELSLQSPDLSLSGTWAKPSGYSTDGVADGTVQAGDSAAVCATGSNAFELQLVWEPEQDDRSVTLVDREITR